MPRSSVSLVLGFRIRVSQFSFTG